MEKTKIKNIKKIYIFMIVIMSLALLCAGLFLFGGGEGRDDEPPEADATGETAGIPDGKPARSGEIPVKHIHRSEAINGLKQEINMLEIDPGAPGVKIRPVLSHDLIYGFEFLSKMAADKNAYAAINGGFFREFGLPSGMVVIDGELISASTGKYPVFVVENGKAELKEIESSLFLEYSGERSGYNSGAGGSNTRDGAGGSKSRDGISGNKAQDGVSSTQDGISSTPYEVNIAQDAVKSVNAGRNVAVFEKTGKIHIDNINIPAPGKQTIVYTPVYGRTNRAERKNITVTVENGIVTRIADYVGEAEIPENGMLVSFFDTGKYAGIELPVRAGDSVRLVHYPEIGSDMQAYECGSWLVKNGVPVVEEKDPWVGVMTNRDPRTAVGIKEDGTVLLFTVDGRQPGYSAGFTGQELAAYLIKCGAKDAAMLDGGASTEMLVEGKLVGRPSYIGQEREIAGGILVLLDR